MTSEKKGSFFLAFLFTLTLITIFSGSSYAILTKQIEGLKTYTLNVGDLDFTITGEQDAIMLENAVPMTDQNGKLTIPYKFTLNNNSSSIIEYDIKLEQDKSDTSVEHIPMNKIKFELKSKGEIVGEGLLADNKILYTKTIKDISSDSYELRLWIDENTTVQEENKLFKVRIVVDGRQVIVEHSLLAEEIMKNQIQETYTLTTTSQEANENGLFKSTDTNDGSPTYFFRGNVQNNYLKFANLDWRIIRINEDGTIRIRLANGINNDQNYQFNSVYNTYDKMYYTNSEIKPIVENWYQEAIGNNSEYASKVVTGNYFCEQAKVKYSDSHTSGNAIMTTYTSYTPNFKCETDGNGKGYVNSQVGLITIDELIHAGGYIGTTNDTFYLYRAGKYDWSMSPAAFYSTYAYAWYLYAGRVNSYRVYYYLGALPVLNLSADVLATGTGTSTDPYVIQ